DGVVTTKIFPQGRWVYVAATVDDQGNGALYWDGQLVATGGAYSTPLVRTEQYLGRSPWPSDAGFTGSMDEVQIWSVQRTADQVVADMTTVPTGSEPGLQAYYPFDEGSGLVAHDA